MSRSTFGAVAADAIGLIAVAAAIAACIFFIVQGIQSGDRLNAEVKQTCIESGGSWVYDSCILPMEKG